MKKKLLLILIPMFCLIIVSCSTHVHQVGTGAQTGMSETQTQWFILFGLVPLNQVDTGAMANGADNYEIKTSTEPIDILIGIPCQYVTVTRRSVTVTQ